MKSTKYSPDTCECIVEYTWDDQVEEASRTHDFSKIQKACPDHAGLTGATLYDTLLKENSTKNKLRQEIIDSITRLTKKITVADGSEVDDLDVDFNWSFTGNDANRQLNLTMTQLTDPEKTQLQSFMDGLSNSTTAVIANG